MKIFYHSAKDSPAARRPKLGGFAIIVSLSMLVLLATLAVSILVMSRGQARKNTSIDHLSIARANARLALNLAIAQLQEHTGPDQRVTANASILSANNAPVANQHWTGVWKTTLTQSGREWPIIGKGQQGPYGTRSSYQDLRTLQGLTRDDLFQTWLVSGDPTQIDPNQVLNSQNGALLVGPGTLGAGAPNDALVFAPKVLSDRDNDGIQESAFAYYISDQSQKGSIALQRTPPANANAPFMASRNDNPAAVQDPNGGGMPFNNFGALAEGNTDRLLSDKSVALLDNNYPASLGAQFHNLTDRSFGLFTNTALGGLKRDLSPLLFGDPNQPEIAYNNPPGNLEAFSSNYPIIPGEQHGVHGPKFAALRDWGLKKYLPGLSNGSIPAELEFDNTGGVNGESLYARPISWDDPVSSDGWAFDGNRWSEAAPKIRPIVTDVRWHYHYSNSGENGVQKLQFHIVPRVCLWNPYNVALSTRELVVLMPNTLRYWGQTGLHMQIEDTEIARLRDRFPYDPNNPPPNAENTPGFLVYRWQQSPNRIINWAGFTRDGQQGFVPNRRHFAFTLNPTTLAPGECQVFSPIANQPVQSAGGISLQEYNPNNVNANRLSPSSPQGGDHFVVRNQQHPSFGEFRPNANQRAAADQVLDAINFNEVFNSMTWSYCWSQPFAFMVKAPAAGANLNVSSDALVNLGAASRAYPTIQHFNHGNSGTGSYLFWYYPWFWGTHGGPWGTPKNNLDIKGRFEQFADNPSKFGQPLHQFGAKMLWLDESATEGNAAPLRVGTWTPDHVAYNVPTIAHYNIRPHLISRSPASPTAINWHSHSNGGFMMQYAPLGPEDVRDQPVFQNSVFVKNPFGLTQTFAASPNAVMFDLPEPELGALSIGALRHAQVSPYSWHPTYVVGHSLVDPHAPFAATAHPIATEPFTGATTSQWDVLIGGVDPWGPLYNFTWGNSSDHIQSDTLLQMGRIVDRHSAGNYQWDSASEVLTYDIAYEVNHNLWDQYFISGMPLAGSGNAFTWQPNNPNFPLWNTRYQFNQEITTDPDTIATSLNGSNSLEFGFWHNAYLLKNAGAFNVNSTSVEAWVSLLSSLQNLNRPSSNGSGGGAAAGASESVYSRVLNPPSAADDSAFGVDSRDAWGGGRVLTDAELRTLATEIVAEVRIRGPFISLSDFVNRRLAPDINQASYRGTIEAAIQRSGLNLSIDQDNRFQTTSNTLNDNAHPDFMYDPDKNPVSKAWGIPGYLTQADILEPIAPALTARGDHFLIRAYGESRDSNGNIVATAYLEAEVERTPEYFEPAQLGTNASNSGNLATDAPLQINLQDETYIETNLTDLNRQMGRRYRLINVRWLSQDEV